MYHAKDLAPHHQYVAAYAWLREGFHDDAPDGLVADLPHLYVYNVDVVGEGLVARRRSMAALVDHMVPPFKKGGLYPELAALGEAINDFDTSLRLALSGTEKIVHSSSTMLYGALDNDDMFMYMGGLATAIRNIERAPHAHRGVVARTRDPPVTQRIWAGMN
jgi:cobalamin biosynthesis Mg chelatase CobN